MTVYFSKLSIMDRKRGQVWVETVIYTLIGLVIIGLVLAVAKPKIEAKQDEVLISQAIESLSDINDKIYEVQKAPGNRRVIDLKIGKGKVVIDMENDKISWILDSSFLYSEEDVEIELGDVKIVSSTGSPYRVTISIYYSLDLRYDNSPSGTKELSESSIPYKLIIENGGISDDGSTLIVDLRIV